MSTLPMIVSQRLKTEQKLKALPPAHWIRVPLASELALSVHATYTLTQKLEERELTTLTQKLEELVSNALEAALRASALFSTSVKRLLLEAYSCIHSPLINNSYPIHLFSDIVIVVAILYTASTHKISKRMSFSLLNSASSFSR